MIRAAGCVVVRDGRALLIHRERYDDWSLPKGKLDPGESWEDAALREVEEETGVRGELGEYLGETSYNGKVVRWWVMRTESEAAPSNEVDAVEWATLDEARARLSYRRDRELVERVLA